MATDLSLLKSAVTSVLELQGSAAEDNANATAQRQIAAGNQQEAQAYDAAVQSSRQAAQLEQTAGDIRDAQQQLKVGRTVASQGAAVAANGFTGDSGSSVALLRASLQQGYLDQQLNQVQTQINRTGYLEQSTAATAEETAATTASSSATTLGNSYANAGQIATANAASQTDAIQKLLTLDYKLNGPLTPEQKATQDVVTSVLSGQLGSAVSLPTSASPGTPIPTFLPGRALNVALTSPGSATFTPTSGVVGGSGNAPPFMQQTIGVGGAATIVPR